MGNKDKRVIKFKEGGTYIEKSEGDLYLGKNPTNENIKEQKLYSKWWFISLSVGILIACFIGYNFNSLYIGLGTGVVSFLILLPFNPERRFFRMAWTLIAYAVISKLPLEIFMSDQKIGYIHFNNQQFPIISVILLLMALVLFILDYLKDKK